MNNTEKSLVSFAKIELSDALDNVTDLKSRLDCPLSTSLLDDIISDIESAYDKLDNFYSKFD